MRELLLDTAPSDFKVEQHLPLGLFCFSDWRKSEIDISNIVFPVTFRDTGELKAASKDICQWANWKIRDLTPKLNEIHGTDFSHIFWRVALLGWLLDLGQLILVRVRLLQSIINDTSQEELFVRLLPKQMEWSFADCLDFSQNGLLNNQFCHWLTSYIVRKIAPAHWKIIECSAPNDRDNRPESSEVKSDSLSKWRIEGVAGVGRLEAPFLGLVLALKPKKEKSSEVLAEKLPISAPKYFDAKLIDLLDELTDLLLPRAYTVDFTKLIAESNHSRFTKGKVRVVGPNLTYSRQQLFKYALAAEAGELLVGTQHGGNNGFYIAHTKQPEIEHKQWAFITWGKAPQYDLDANYICLPSPTLSRFKKRCRNRSASTFTGLTLIGTQIRHGLFRLDTHFNDFNAVEYCLQKRQFIENVDASLRSKLFYRPQITQQGLLNDTDFIDDDIGILHGDLHERIIDGIFPVIDHPGTTLLLCAAADIPFVCYWSEKIYPISDHASHILAKLHNANILFDNPKDTALFLSQTWLNIEDWWQKQETRDAICAFNEEYAQTNRFWALKWAKSLWNI